MTTDPKCPLCGQWLDSEGHSFSPMTATCPKVPAGRIWSAPADHTSQLLRDVEDQAHPTPVLINGAARAFQKLIHDLAELGEGEFNVNAAELRGKLLREMAAK